MEILTKIIKILFGFYILLCACFVSIPCSPILLAFYLLKYLEEFIYLTVYNAEKTFASFSSIDNVRTWLLVIDGTPDLLDIQENVVTSLIDSHSPDGSLCYTNLSKQLKSGLFNSYWKDESKFSVNEHVYLFEEDSFFTVSEVRKIISKLKSDKLPNKLSPWRIVVMELEKNKTALVFQCHPHLQYIDLIRSLVEGHKTCEHPVENNIIFDDGLIFFCSNLCMMFYNLFETVFTTIKDYFTAKENRRAAIVEYSKTVTWTKPSNEVVINNLALQLKVDAIDVIIGCLHSTNVSMSRFNVETNHHNGTLVLPNKSTDQVDIHNTIFLSKKEKSIKLFENKVLSIITKSLIPNYLASYLSPSIKSQFTGVITTIPAHNNSTISGQTWEAIIDCGMSESVTVCVTNGLGNVIISTWGIEQDVSNQLYSQIDSSLKILTKNTGIFPKHYK